MWGKSLALELQILTANVWRPTAAATPKVVSKEYATKYLAATTECEKEDIMRHDQMG